MDFAKFEQRKRDHITLALDDDNQAPARLGLADVRLIHEALPEVDFETVSIKTTRFGEPVATPFLISSMTAGHRDGVALNAVMAEVAGARGWAMGVGSQRRQLHDPEADKEWAAIRKASPKVNLLGNIGLSQLITTNLAAIERLVDSLEATAMIIHTNPLQECLQPEGTPQFKGGLQAITKLCQSLSVPVIIKETGCGFSKATLQRLCETGVSAVDMSGLGGTHWGRIEGARAEEASLQQQAAATFANWGIGTIESLLAAKACQPDYEIWGSGGVRTGLDAAKLLALGASTVGFARPVIEAALEGPVALDKRLAALEYELKIALLCTGCETIGMLQEKDICRV